MATFAPAIMALSTSCAVWTPLVSARSALTFAVQDRNPAQRQPQVARSAQFQGSDDFQFFQIEIGLVEAVEQHQAVCAGIDKAAGEIGQGSDEWAELDRQRNADRRLDFCDQVHLVVFEFLSRSGRGSAGR